MTNKEAIGILMNLGWLSVEPERAEEAISMAVAALERYSGKGVKHGDVSCDNHNGVGNNAGHPADTEHDIFKQAESGDIENDKVV